MDEERDDSNPHVTESPYDTKKIVSIALHAAKIVEGQMVHTVGAKRLGVTLTLGPLGVHVKGPHTDKLIPYSNIPEIEYYDAADET